MSPFVVVAAMSATVKRGFKRQQFLSRGTLDARPRRVASSAADGTVRQIVLLDGQ